MTDRPHAPASDAPVVVVTLNPAFDLILEVDNFQIGVHQLGRELQLLPAGKGLNVCRTLDALGTSSIITGFLGQESISDFEQALHDTSITAQFFTLPGMCGLWG